MPIDHLELLDYEKFSGTPITAGERSLVSNSHAKEYIGSLFEETTNEAMEMVATCDCGRLSGNFYKGVKCDQCNSIVRDTFVDDLNYKGWLIIPDELPPVLHPVMYRVLKGAWLKTLLPILLDPSLDLPERFKGKIGAQGFTYFHENFDDLMNFLLKHHKHSQAMSNGIVEFIKKYRSMAFTRKLPVLDSSLHMLTKNVKGHFSDDSGKYVLKSLITLSDMSYSIRNKVVDDKFIDRNLWVFYSSYLEYVNNICDKKLFTKQGFVRKHMFGTRYHCSFRGVIVPITKEHAIDELHWPWKIGVISLKLEILNCLINRQGYELNDALAKHHRAQFVYDSDIDAIMKTLISECGYTDEQGNFVNLKGLPVLFGRLLRMAPYR